MPLQVYFISGRPIPSVQALADETLADLRRRVAKALGSIAERVELLIDGELASDDAQQIIELGNVKIQAFVTSAPDVDDNVEADKELSHGGDQQAKKFDPHARVFDPDEPDLDPIPEEMRQGHSGQLGADCAQQAADHGGDEQLGSQQGASVQAFALHAACGLQGTESLAVLAELLADGADLAEQDEQGDTALHRAAYHGRADLAALLLHARADHAAVDKKGKTPLRKAYDNKDVAGILLEARADPNVADKCGNTVLHRTVEDGQGKITELLLGVRASVTVVNDDGLMPLHLAALSGASDAVSLLLAARAAVDARAVGGDTALHLAAQIDDEAMQGCDGEVARALIRAGADSDARNDAGQTPLDVWKGIHDGDSPEWLLPRVD